MILCRCHGGAAPGLPPVGKRYSWRLLNPHGAQTRKSRVFCSALAVVFVALSCTVAWCAKVGTQAWCAGFGCLQHQHGKGIARQGGWLQSLPTPALGNHPACHAQKKPPMKKTIKTVNGWGGRRKGAGRPAGTRNKPRLIHGLPETDDPLQWLLALMAHEGATLRQRMAAAKVLLPYCHAMP